MPLARIDLIEGKSAEYRRTIADVVYDKMIECLGVPEDRFQTISEHKAENFLFDADYLGIIRRGEHVTVLYRQRSTKKPGEWLGRLVLGYEDGEVRIFAASIF